MLRGWAVLGLLVAAGCNCGQVPGGLLPDPIFIRPCETDSDCAPDERCIDKICQKVKVGAPDASACQSDGDCPDLRYACLAGACVLKPGVCLSDADCAPGYECNPVTNSCVVVGARCDTEGATRPCSSAGLGACAEGTQTCGSGVWGTCVSTRGPRAETCDGSDDDCDGQTDEDFDLRTDPANCGACGHGCVGHNAHGLCFVGLCGSWSCDPGWVDLDGLEDNGCEYRCSISSGAVEMCDGADDDCDGQTDEDQGTTTCGEGACQRTVANCVDGVEQVCVPGAPRPEGCNGEDDDCDGLADEDLGTTTCGTGACQRTVANCVNGVDLRCTPGAPAAESCNGVDDDCDGQTDEDLGTTTCGTGACARTVANCANGTAESCQPGTPGTEVCNGADDDCDGQADEDLGTTTCGTGACTQTIANCENGVAQACEPGAPSSELCNGIDDSCDGQTDEGLGTTTCGTGACARTVARCLDGFAQVCEPGAPAAEACNGVDDDCDGETDEALGTTSCGTGACARTVASCVDGEAQACVAGAPAAESCNGSDDDCDGLLDENVTLVTQDGSSQRVDPVIRPVDVIFVVANNGTMNEEIQAVEANINQNFAAIVGQSGVDYRVVMISKYGYGASTGNYALCIQPPLGGNATCDGTCPVNTDRFFHYSADIGAHDSLSQVLATYAAPDACGLAPNGWSQWLRPQAAKVFIEITDNGPTSGNPDQANAYTADAFEAGLFATAPEVFGTAASRAYRFHSIVGLAENDPVSAAWLPDVPLVDARCTGNGGYVQQPGLEYQRLSVRTGGLRYPICQYQSFDAIFADVARKIVVDSVMACEFTVSAVPADSSLDNTLMDLVAGEGSGSVALAHVASAQECSGNAFYVEGTTIKLCPDACTLWRADPTATAEVSFTCHRQLP